MPTYSDYKKAKGKLSGVSAREAAAAGWDKKYAKDTGQESTPSKEKPKEESPTIQLGKPKEDVIQLGGEKKQENILEKTKDIPVVGKTLAVLASPKTTLVLGAVLAGTLAASALTGITAKAAASSGSLIGKHINVDAIGKSLGLTARQTASLAKEVGRRRISQIANTITNPKAAGLMQNILTKTFSGKALALLGTGAGTIFLGKWGQAEAGEPLSIVMRDIMKLAEETGDWSLYDEAAAARDELTNLSAWETILSNTPFISPFIGIPNKIKGIKQAGAILDEVARQKQIQEANGESEDDKWKRIEEERTERREQERIDDEQYYAQVQKDLADAKKSARKADEKYWAGVLADREKSEKAKREADEKYWADIRKANSEIKEAENKAFEEYGNSNLNFGLL